MKKLIQYKEYRSRHSFLIWFLWVTCCIITIIFTDDAYLADPIIPNTTQNLVGVFANETADVGIAMIVIVGSYVIFSFTNDLKYRRINFELLSGNSRKKVFTSHYVYIFILSGSMIASSLFIGACKYGFEEWLGDVWANKGYFLRMIFFIYLVSFSIISFCFIFAVIFKDTAKATIITFIFLFLTCYIMAAIASSVTGDKLSSAYENPSIFLLSYPTYMWRWVLNPDLGAMELLAAGIISIVWCGIDFFVSCYYFCRIEL